MRKPYRFVTTGMAREMRALRAEGLTFDCIAERMGVSDTTVANYTRDIPRDARRGPRRPLDRAAMLRLKREGLTVADIAQRFATTSGAVENHLREARRAERASGLRHVPGDKVVVTTKLRDRIRALRMEGLGYRRIAAVLDHVVCAHTVRNHVRDLPIPPRASTCRIDRRHLLALSRDGLSGADLAERFGSTPRSIHVLLWHARREERARSSVQPSNEQVSA